ncbi:restriction endonuclease subunit S [Dysgonomonas capnocytophagoides]|uniref:restriction endonuclease subunit S n=1 Tax=Dysgonomonas capnocytophagoides TaxID=45254 RepID=UPI00399150AB
MRFPQFHGEWEETSLSSLGDFIGGGTPSSAIINFWEGNIPWISSSDLSESNINRINVTRYITEEAIDNSATKICQAPTILIVSRVGVGKVAYSKENICTSQDFTNIVNLKSDGLFLTYLLSKIMRQKARETQGTSIKGITSGEIKSIKINIPQNNEQEKIATFLSLIDERIQTQNKIIKELESLIKGIRQTLFKETTTWKSCKIGDILKIGSGRDYKHLETGNIPVFGTGGYMLSVNDYLYDGESVCIGRKGTINKPLFLYGKFWTVDTLFYTYNFQRLLPRFCYYLFSSINWLQYNEASGVPSLSKETIENIQVHLPNMGEQEKICSILDLINSKLETENKTLSAYQVQKKYILNKLFI